MGAAASVPDWWGSLAADEAAVLAAYRRPRAPLERLTAPALLVVDAVESFYGPDAPVAEAQRAARTACGEHGWRAVEPTARLLAAFRRAGLPVLYTVVQDEDDLRAPGAAEAGQPPRLRGDRVVEPLAPASGELVVPKTTASAFAGTPVPRLLAAEGVRTVVLAGCTTSGCVLATVISAAAAGLEAVVARDACFDRVPTLADAALITMDAKWARVLPTADVLSLIPADEGRPPRP